MLVISNGAMKCGSTWLTSILREMVDHEPLPEGFHDERFGEVPTIKRLKLKEFLEDVDYHNYNYVSKNHFYYERRLLSRYEDVYVLDIERDLPDTLVSLFFHAKKKLDEWQMDDETLEGIKSAYWLYGPKMASGIVRYHAVWRRKAPWVYVSSYERLKADAAKEIGAIGSFLGLDLSDEEIQRIIDATTFKKMANRQRPADSGMQARFRKGVVGDHKNYFDEKIIADIRRIERENKNYPSTLLEKIDFAFKSFRYAGKIYESPA
ncbi:MAG TPA: sulfotransferase domain-containing protein [Acidobacteriota bacterium]|nr:sulfotransferase domain-containing protein [Acidobacteriota bacterium]